jgi:hypothetical protein
MRSHSLHLTFVWSSSSEWQWRRHMVSSKTLTVSIQWPSRLKIRKCLTTMACARTKYLEVHLAVTVEQHLHGPHADQAARYPHYELVELLPIDHRRELLGEVQPIPTHAQVDGDTKVDRTRRGRWKQTRAAVVNHPGLAHTSSLSTLATNGSQGLS